MEYFVLVNKDHALDRTFVPDDLVDAKSRYKEGILVNKKLLDNFRLMAKDAYNLGYDIDKNVITRIETVSPPFHGF